MHTYLNVYIKSALSDYLHFVGFVFVIVVRYYLFILYKYKNNASTNGSIDQNLIFLLLVKFGNYHFLPLTVFRDKDHVPLIGAVLVASKSIPSHVQSHSSNCGFSHGQVYMPTMLPDTLVTR